METEEAVQNVDSPTMFGDLYEWNMCTIPQYQITSLLISDDVNFSNIDLSLICAISPLRQLFLHNLPNLSTLPPALARLTLLKVISISHCDSIVELPLAVKFLSNLETIRLDCPNLKELPGFLCLKSGLKLLLLRKSVGICNQCKQYPRKSTRIILSPLDDDISQSSQVSTQSDIIPLSVLAANSYISHFSQSIVDNIIPFRILWPFIEEALALKLDRCIICFTPCSKNQRFSIGFTRLLNCKCVHLVAYICSDSCQSTLRDYLCAVYSTSDILTSAAPHHVSAPPSAREPISTNLIHRRVKKMFSWLSSCVPRYRKKSYTVNAD